MEKNISKKVFFGKKFQLWKFHASTTAWSWSQNHYPAAITR